MNGIGRRIASDVLNGRVLVRLRWKGRGDDWRTVADMEAQWGALLNMEEDTDDDAEQLPLPW